jgi:hypothetical protein
MTATQTPADRRVGLFLVTYAIGGEALAAPQMSLTMTVDTVRESVAGMSHVTQTVNPPVDVASRVSGDVTYMTVMPRRTHILVTATGVPMVKWPEHGGIGPVLMPNLNLRMVLEDGWQTGTATYNYLDPEGRWQTVSDAPVRVVPGNVLS